MMVLITGGSGSGKSAYAEDCIGKLSGNGTKYYLATMQVYDEEGQARIERHRQMRAGKGFCTIEQPVNIEEAIAKMGRQKNELSDCQAIDHRTALLECMSNLVANEMFSAKMPRPVNEVADKIVTGIEQLSQKVKHLVIVTNNVFEDGIVYDRTTMEYIQALGQINERIAGMADQVTEVVVGIPVMVKIPIAPDAD